MWASSFEGDRVHMTSYKVFEKVFDMRKPFLAALIEACVAMHPFVYMHYLAAKRETELEMERRQPWSRANQAADRPAPSVSSRARVSA